MKFGLEELINFYLYTFDDFSEKKNSKTSTEGEIFTNGFKIA